MAEMQAEEQLAEWDVTKRSRRADKLLASVGRKPTAVELLASLRKKEKKAKRAAELRDLIGRKPTKAELASFRSNLPHPIPLC